MRRLFIQVSPALLGFWFSLDSSSKFESTQSELDLLHAVQLDLLKADKAADSSRNNQMLLLHHKN